MSQAKVDKYKEEKANRKQNIKKAKIKNAFRTVLVSLICVLCVGYIAFSAVNSYQTNKSYEYAEVNIDALSDYINAIVNYEAE